MAVLLGTKKTGEQYLSDFMELNLVSIKSITTTTTTNFFAWTAPLGTTEGANLFSIKICISTQGYNYRLKILFMRVVIKVLLTAMYSDSTEMLFETRF